ncbi:MAG: hypothetical protein ABFS17_14060, partial [Chloroflexota bacterium]
TAVAMNESSLFEPAGAKVHPASAINPSKVIRNPFFVLIVSPRNVIFARRRPLVQPGKRAVDYLVTGNNQKVLIDQIVAEVNCFCTQILGQAGIGFNQRCYASIKKAWKNPGLDDLLPEDQAKKSLT